MKAGKTAGDGQCESCVYYDYDAEIDCEICTLSLDQDEESQLRQRGYRACLYYRYYDEYTSVRKQN